MSNNNLSSYIIEFTLVFVVFRTNLRKIVRRKGEEKCKGKNEKYTNVFLFYTNTLNNVLFTF